MNQNATIAVGLSVVGVLLLLAVGLAGGHIPTWYDNNTLVAQRSQVDLVDTASIFTLVDLTDDGTEVTFTITTNDADTPADGECATYQASTTNILWTACAGGGGGGATNTVDENAVEIVNPAVGFDFKDGFDITDQGGSTAGIHLDLTEATLTDDSAWIGSAAGFAVATAFVDCNSAGNAFNYDTATNATSCRTLADGDIPDSITIDLATNATNLAADPSDCGAGTFADAIDAQGDLTCNAVDISADTNLTAGRSVTLTGDDLLADTELYTHTITVPAVSATTTNDNIGVRMPFAFTVTNAVCATSAGETTISIDRRALTALFALGTHMLRNIGCTTTGTTIAAASWEVTTAAADTWMVFNTSSTDDATASWTISVLGTADD